MAHRIQPIGLVLAGVLLAACQLQTADPRERSAPMSDNTQIQNKDVVRRLFEEGLNRDRADVVEKLVGAEYVDASGERGPNAFKQVMVRLRTAFPDLTYTLDDILGEGDRVAVRWHWTGTHRGPFRGIPPTERSLTNTGSAIFRLSHGQIVAAALETDRLGFLQAIGVVPPNEKLFTPPAATPPAAAAR
jgi:predicted ester cyclase